MVCYHRSLIQEIQTDDRWQDVTAPMLELVRSSRLRALVKLIDTQKRQPIYTGFED
jgi:type I restriction enzyme R subunit